MITAYVVSAFTSNGMGGNKAGVVLDADRLTVDQMQTIAQTLTYSETAFVSKSTTSTYKVRFFTPTTEVDLCGHATIATWSLLFQKGLIKHGMYAQETLAGDLGIKVQEDGSVFMQQAIPKFLGNVSIEEIMPVLGIDETGFETVLAPQVVSTGLSDLLVPVRTKEVLMNLQPDLEKMIILSKKYDVIGLHVFAIDNDGTATARNFAPRVGINEEPATGTSNSALLCYLKKYGQLEEKDMYRVEQGKNMGQPSAILGTFIDGRVWIGGQAAIRDKRTVKITPSKSI